jgi:PAS domain S-box-containing protein
MSPSARVWLVVAPPALAVGAVTSVLTARSEHVNLPGLQAALGALIGGAFVAAGLIARTRRPLNRTGWLLIAVGFTWLLGGVWGTDQSLLWTLGVAFMALPAGFLIHLLLAYPSGRLHSTWERLVVVTGYVLVTVGHGSHLLVEPDPLQCEECPSNAFLVSEQDRVADVLTSSIQIIAVAYLLAVVGTLFSRWRRASPAARRTLTPVFVAGGATLLLFAVSVGAQTFSHTLSEVTGWIASFVLVGVPFLFLSGLLKSRLARADISRALVEEPTGGAQERIRQLLHDPRAELLYACAEPSRGYVDVDGRPRDAVAEPGRAVTPIEREGRLLGAIVHDEVLLDEPELLEEVAAAVGLEIERDQNLQALEASERRSRALLDALPDRIFRVSREGIILDVQENPGSATPRAGLQVGSSVYDSPVAREVVDRILATGKLALQTGELKTIEWDVVLDGDRRHAEGRFVPSGDDEFLVVIRDVTERKRQEVEQSALHRVALAVAGEIRPERMFDLVAEEVGSVLGAHSVSLLRYEPGFEEAVVVGRWTGDGVEVEFAAVGESVSLVATPIHLVYETRRPIRVDLEDGKTSPELAADLRAHMVNSVVAAPITVSGRLWGVVAASLTPPHAFWVGAEERLGAFTRLVSLALANEEAREQLSASLFALEASERRSRALLEASPDSMFRISRDGRILDYRVQPPIRIFRPAEGMIGSDVYDADFPKEITARTMALGEQALATGELQLHEYEIEVEGELRYQEERITPSGADEFVVIVRDVTERKRQEQELQSSERRSRALLEAMPDNMFRISADGIFLDIQETPSSQRPVHAKVGSSVYDYPGAPRNVIDRVMAAGKRALETGELQTIEWKLGSEGDLRYQEGRFMPSGEREFFLVVRDVTERKRREEEQAALHRVALAVAGEARAERIFDLVTEEVGRVLGAHGANLIRYEPGGEEAVIVGGWSEPGASSEPVGERYRMQGGAAHTVYRTGRPVRFELDEGTVPPRFVEQMQEMGVNSLIAAPITVTGRPWGAVIASLTAPHSFPAGAEERLGAFTRLVSLALANEEAREQLAASRARLVSAGDEERRRLERNLHDGAQQRLVSVSLSLRLAQARLASDPAEAEALLAGANAELSVALEELRELARGIHPAVLTERGLGPALASLADRTPLPVEFEQLPDERLPGQVEAAAYYVVSEALANVAKYAAASSVSVRVEQRNGRAVIEVVDDGVGGAQPEHGSGLRGLADRVEALDGHLAVVSPAGKGTTIRAEIPVPKSPLDALAAYVEGGVGSPGGG